MRSLVSLFLAAVGTAATVYFAGLKKKLYPHGTFYKNIVMAYVTQLICSERYRRLVWWISHISRKRPAELKKSDTSSRAALAFVCADDPHSFVLLQCLRRFIATYPMHVQVVVLPVGLKAWSTDAKNQIEWAVRDSKDFCELYELSPPVLHPSKQNKGYFSAATNELLTASASAGTKNMSAGDACVARLSACIDILERVWRGTATATTEVDNAMSPAQATALAQNDKLLRKVGYYGPGVVEVEGELYSSSRLHHLERRLRGLRNDLSDANMDSTLLFCKEFESWGRSRPYPAPSIATTTTTLSCSRAGVVDPVAHVVLYYSFRSPYSQLAVGRLRKLCAQYNAVFSVRCLMPMVMRGLSVPFAKVTFIMMDTAREARLWGLDYGFACDPIACEGRPVMRAFDAYMTARKYGAEVEFIETFAQLQWGNGVCAGTDMGLKQMVEAASKKAGTSATQAFGWKEVQQNIGNADVEAKWRALTERNKSIVYSSGLWGVPCISAQRITQKGTFNGHLDRDMDLPTAVADNFPSAEEAASGEKLFVWGQDKLWQVERFMKECQQGKGKSN